MQNAIRAKTLTPLISIEPLGLYHKNHLVATHRSDFIILN